MPMYKDENGATYTYPTELSKEAVANGNLAVMTEKEIAEMTKADDDLMKAGVDEHGFVNLHTDDKENGKGDGKWYSAKSSRTQHKGEPEMTRGEAIGQKIVLG